MKKGLSAQKIWYFLSAVLLFVSAALISSVFVLNDAKSREVVFRSGVSFLEAALNAEVTKISDDIYLGLETLSMTENEVNHKLGELGKVHLEFAKASSLSSQETSDKIFAFSRVLSDSATSSQSTVALYFGDILTLPGFSGHTVKRLLTTHSHIRLDCKSQA